MVCTYNLTRKVSRRKQRLSPEAALGSTAGSQGGKVAWKRKALWPGVESHRVFE